MANLTQFEGVENGAIHVFKKTLHACNFKNDRSITSSYLFTRPSLLVDADSLFTVLSLSFRVLSGQAQTKFMCMALVITQ